MILDLDFREFEISEGVTVELKPLEIWAYQSVLPIVSSSFQSDSGNEQDQIVSGLKQLSNEQLTKVIDKVFPVHAKNLKGIQIKENGATRDCTVDDLCKQGALLSVAFQILIQLITISALNQSEAVDLKK